MPVLPRKALLMEPVLNVVEVGGAKVAELEAGIVVTERDATDLVGNAAYLGAGYVLLRAEQLAPEFFDLSSGLAGAVMQKFANYRVGLVIVGYDVGRASESLLALMTESNRGRSVWFVVDRDEALARIEGT